MTRVKITDFYTQAILTSVFVYDETSNDGNDYSWKQTDRHLQANPLFIELNQWRKQYPKGKITIDISPWVRDEEQLYEIVFEDSQDAISFKLVFGEYL